MFPLLIDWITFGAVLVALLVVDLFVSVLRAHVIRVREAAIYTVIWTGIALAVGVWIFIRGGGTLATEYYTAYIAEQALSADNIFVFLIIFNYFSPPAKYHARILFIAIVGALVTRGVLLAVGVTLINNFSWIHIILGLFLLFTAIKLWKQTETKVTPDKNPLIRLLKRFIPISEEYDGAKMFTRKNGALMATPMLLVIATLLSTDILFAVDSIPTVLGISQNAFIVWTSNATAVLGLIPLYFLLANMVDKFRYLKNGLVVVLAFVGLRIIVDESLHLANIELPISSQVSAVISLSVILLILGVSVILSLVVNRREENRLKAEEPLK